MGRILVWIIFIFPTIAFATGIRCEMAFTSSLSQTETIVSELREIYSRPNTYFHDLKVQKYFQARYSRFDEEINRIVDLVSGKKTEETQDLTRNLSTLNDRIYQATLKLKALVEKKSSDSERSQSKANELSREIALCKGRGGFCEVQIQAAYDNLEQMMQKMAPTVAKLDEEVLLLSATREKVIADPFFDEHLEVEHALSAQIGRFSELSMIVKAAFARQENTMRAAVKELGVYGQELPTLLRGVLLSGQNNGFLKRDFMLKSMDEKTAGYSRDIESIQLGDIGYVRGITPYYDKKESGASSWGGADQVRRVQVLEILPNNKLKVRILKSTILKKTVVIGANDIAIEGSRDGWDTGEWLNYSYQGADKMIILGFNMKGAALLAPDAGENTAQRIWVHLYPDKSQTPTWADAPTF